MVRYQRILRHSRCRLPRGYERAGRYVVARPRLSGAAGAPDRAVCTRRQLGHHRAALRPAVERVDGTDVRRRQPARRRRRDRDEPARESHGRRLHAHPPGHAAHDQSGRVRRRTLRSAARLHADHARRARAAVAVRASGSRGEVGARARRAGKVSAGSAQDRLRRQRQRHAPDGRAPHARRRYPDDARAVQRRGSGSRRDRRRRDERGVHVHAGGDRIRAGRAIASDR